MSTLYAGKLSRQQMSREVRRAYQTYYRQRRTKGVTYSVEEYTAWWLENIQSFKGLRPTCGRIDHSKPYSFDNIQIQDLRDNASEAILRNKTHIKNAQLYGKPIDAYCPTTGSLVISFPSKMAAARYFRVNSKQIYSMLSGKIKNSLKVPFVLRGAA